MMQNVKLALIQMKMTTCQKTNVQRAIEFVTEAAHGGANIVLLPELFENVYFCQTQQEEYFALAHDVHEHPFIKTFQDLAKKLNIVIPLSFFEKSGPAYFNSLVLIHADGTLLGCYRKTHIPDGPGYQEKYYFNPGDTGFQVWNTTFGVLGVGICWDQWFPECARSLVLQGAQLILYPTAIGSEPPEAHALETQALWQRAMVGHAVCNSVYVAAANRVGKEQNQNFYGSSFVCDYMGHILTQADHFSEQILFQEINYRQAEVFRASMGFFRDRRPEHYTSLLSLSDIQKKKF
jgi:N-carbamoylputrescine amidase